MYDLEVTNRFNGLDLVESLKNEWTEIHIVQEAVIKTIPKKKKCKKVKQLPEEVLQIAVKIKRSERQRRKGKIYSFECRVPRNSKER